MARLQMELTDAERQVICLVASAGIGKPDFGKELANVVEFPKTKRMSPKTAKSRGTSKEAE